MRIWDIPPAQLCRKHLLGEHRELHGLWNILTKHGGVGGYSRHPETLRWVGKSRALYNRHEALVKEFARRGYQHHTPLDKRLATGSAIQRQYIHTLQEQKRLLYTKQCECFQRVNTKRMIKKETRNPVDAYIAAFPRDVQVILNKVRATVRAAAPKATEGMGYGIPAFMQNGPLAYFAGFKKHIGFYPVPTGMAAFKKELSVYKTGKGSVQFPLDQPIPYALIKKIVRFRVRENMAKKKRK